VRLNFSSLTPLSRVGVLMDQTDRLAAATIVAGMLICEHTLLGDRALLPGASKAGR
jgi:hypothetical protein